MPEKKRRSSISARFRNLNVLLFLFFFCVMTALIVTAVTDVSDTVAEGYARQTAVGVTETLATHIDRDIALLAKATDTDAVADWFLDEDDPDKRAAAYAHMSSVLDDLHSVNLYAGILSSLSEYRVSDDYDFVYVDRLSEADPEDIWFFNCIEAEGDYLFSIGIDHELERKRVWLDYKVTRGDTVLGVVCTGLDFPRMIYELFSSFERENMRGIIINADGMAGMDSRFVNETHYMEFEYETPVTDILDASAAGIIRRHLNKSLTYYTQDGAPAVYGLSDSEYRRMTVSPIKDTGWAVIILSGPSSVFDRLVFLPVAVMVLAILILFAAATAFADYRLIFSPLKKLDKSLAVLNSGTGGMIYGLERNDEIGDLSTTVYDLFNKAHIDQLTGIYNRRFLENNLQRSIETLAQSGGNLSVLMLDVDFFKKYNDTYGHDAGDECLKKVAGALADSVTRAGDFVARYGGEEFTAVLPDTDEAGARLVAEKLLANVRALNIPHMASVAAEHVTVSVGVTTGKVSYMHKWQDYIKHADKALYESKESGRDRYTFKHY